MWFTAVLMGKRRGQALEQELFAALPSSGEIRRLVDRERARSDRTGAPLSVIVFTPPNAEALAQLAGFLRERLRDTDEVGWLDTGRLCAVLPDTPLAGAYKVADEALQAVPVEMGTVGCVVYTYPDHPPEELDANAVAPAERLEPLLAPPMSPLKRAFDITAASLAILVLSPLLAAVALAIRLTSPGPALFKQRRSGRGGRPFVIYKFRTMVADAEAKKARLLAVNEQDGPAFKMKRDPRVTWLGRFLRATSIDELPQLFNVLLGDMSIVGPRPLPCDETDRCESWQRRRLMVTPGITCIWQVRGRCRVSFHDWMRMDIRYIRTQSFGQDVRLVFETFPAVLLGRGAQ